MVAILNFCTKIKKSYFLALTDPLDQSQPNQNWWNDQLGLKLSLEINLFLSDWTPGPVIGNGGLDFKNQTEILTLSLVIVN